MSWGDNFFVFWFVAFIVVVETLHATSLRRSLKNKLKYPAKILFLNKFHHGGLVLIVG